MKKHKRSKYIALALDIGTRLDNHDLCVRCALEYLTLPVFFRRRARNEESRACIENADNNRLSAFTYVEKELYCASVGDAIEHTKNAYDASILALAQDNSKDSMLLYERSLEEYLYHLMLDEGSSLDLVFDIWQRTDKILKKLTLITSDITFTDKRLTICNDFEIYANQRGKNLTLGEQKQEILDKIGKERKSKNNDFKRKKDVYRSLAIKLGIVGFLLYTIVEFLDFKIVSYEILMKAQISGLLCNITETVANILLSVMIFFGFLLIYSYEKRSFNYESDNKSLAVLSSSFCAMFVISVFFHLYNRRLLHNPVSYDAYAFGIVNALFHSVIFAFSILWFIVYAFAIPVCGPFKYSIQEKAKYKFRFKEIISRHIKLILLSAIPFITFIPYAFYTPRYGLDVSIDMFGTTPSIYLNYCYIPLILQLTLSGVELFVMYKHYGKPQRIIAKNKSLIKNKSTLIKHTCITCCFIVACTLCVFISNSVFKKQLFEQYEYTVSEDFVYYLSDGKAVIQKYNGRDKHVTIPSKLDGYEVCDYNGSVFKESSVISVTIPEGITEIDSYMFKNCAYLKEVHLPASVASIDSYAFDGCPELKIITTKNTGNIEFSSTSFDNCEGIKALDEVKKNGYYMIGNNIAWVDKENICGAVYIPNGVTRIDSSMFSNAKHITEIHLPETLKEIYSSAFYNCTSLYYIKLPSSLNEIRNNAFMNCTRLTLIDNNSSIPLECGSELYGGIAKYAIYISKNNDALANKQGDFIFAYDSNNDSYTLVAGDESKSQLILPSEYKGQKYSIYKYFISINANTVNVVLPSGYSWDYNNYGRTHLYRVEYDNSSMILQDGIPCFVNTEAKNVIVCRPSVPLDIVTIGNIEGCEDYTYVIRSYAFSGKELTELNILSSCDVGQYAFESCKALTRVSIRGKAVKLDKFSFQNCSASLLEVDADTVAIEYYAFQASDIESASVRGTSVKIDNSFTYCKKLKNVVLKGNVSLLRYAFSSCVALESLDLTDCVELGDYVFASSENLKAIYLSNKLKKLSTYAFNAIKKGANVYFNGSYADWDSIAPTTEEGGDLYNKDFNLYINNELVTDKSLYAVN